MIYRRGFADSVKSAVFERSHPYAIDSYDSNELLEKC